MELKLVENAVGSDRYAYQRTPDDPFLEAFRYNPIYSRVYSKGLKLQFHFCTRNRAWGQSDPAVHKFNSMPASIITTDDLLEFKMELLEEIGQLLDNRNSGVIKKEWLKSVQVMEMLHISAGTLQSFRTNGTLPYTKIGGILFYDAEDIQEILLRNKVNQRKARP